MNPRFKQEQPPYFSIEEGPGPLIATAIHNGHAVREEVAAHLALDEEERRREEDPFTGRWTAVTDTRIVAQRSRFEVDFNRPRHKAVYRRPEDAWGLEVWNEIPPPDDLVERSLEEYDAFYEAVGGLLRRMKERHGRFLVFDLHSYNHRREGPDAEAAPADGNPEVNVGTGSLDRARWTPVVDRFMQDLQAFDFGGRSLDVRENVRFTGGHFAQWIHEQFPESGCVLAIEFKKFFMNEWTGEPYEEELTRCRQALASTVPGVLEALTSSPLPAETTHA